MRHVDLTTAAEEDLTEIWLYTYEKWGFEQAEKYYDQIVSCCEAVGGGKARSKPVKGLTDDIHVHRCERHYIFFVPDERPIVLAILHGRMDFLARLQGRL
jgi:toxin ParE1/3/4